MIFKHPQAVLDYFQRINAEVLNFKRAMVKIHKGNYYLERALIRLSADGTLTTANKEFEPTEEEKLAIKAAMVGVEFPKCIRARTSHGLMGLTKGDTFEFLDRPSGEIIMVQERRMRGDGTKAYIPWVMLSTGEWISMEPEGDLPFFKPKKGKGPGAKIMVHEGAKAAQAAQRIVDGQQEHPWLEELTLYEHWGMIGGALAPHRTNYEELAREKPTEVIYVCDNDQPGEQALPKISRAWRRSLKGVKFGKAFPINFDMADPMPKNLFAKKGRYIGPRIADLLEPATLATDTIPNPEGKGRPLTIIRTEFAEEWHHAITPEVFVHRDWPNRILTSPEFNNKVDPFSAVNDTSRLLKKEFASKAAILKYTPGIEPGVYGGDSGGTFINTFVPSTIKPDKGRYDAAPWLEFMGRLVTDEDDRDNLLHWCATLIARPDVRMLYGVLMISETQGIGKGTLGEKILAPLIGEYNVSYPSEQDIVESQFNYWLAHKRLAVVHEIYAGHSSRAYDKLKSIITDKNVTVQKKYMAAYEVESWLHIFACSNSQRALKLSIDDRRWFVPKLSEEKMPPKYWDQTNDWLTQEGGLQAIAAWARDYVYDRGPIERGMAAPWSALKRILVEETYSPGQMIIARTLETVKEAIDGGRLPKNAFVLDSQLIDAVRNELYDGRHNEKLERPSTARAVAKAQGWGVGEVRAQVKAWGPTTRGARVVSLCEKTVATPPGELGREPVNMVQLAAM